MAAEIRIVGESLQVGTVHALFGGFQAGGNSGGYPYDISEDGQRILAAIPAASGTTSEPITLVQNWMAGLKK